MKLKPAELIRIIEPGSIFGFWKIIDNVPIVGNKSFFVKCKCTNCNKTITNVNVGDIMRFKSQGCLACRKKINDTKKTKIYFDNTYIHSFIKCSENKVYKGMLLSVFNKMKRGAEARSMPFNISIIDVAKQFEKQKGICSLSGLPLKLRTYTNDITATASLDRIDNNKGYLKNNIQWIHKEINFMKGSLQENRFIELCKHIAKNKKHAQ